MDEDKDLPKGKNKPKKSITFHNLKHNDITRQIEQDKRLYNKHIYFIGYK